MKRKTFLFITMGLGTFLIAFFVIKTFVNAQDERSIKPKGSDQKLRKTPEQEKDDQDTPKILFESDQSAAPTQRVRKNRKYDDARVVAPPDRTNGMGSVTSYDETPIVDIPAQQSNIILIGTVTDSKAYLSNNKTGVYSEFTLLTESVLKNNTSRILSPGDTIIGTRGGGIVQYSSGKSVRYGIAGKGSLALNNKYIVFLKQTDEDDFKIITGYIFKDGAVYPLDGARLYLISSGGTPYDKHTGQNVQTFLDEVLAAIRNN